MIISGWRYGSSGKAPSSKNKALSSNPCPEKKFKKKNKTELPYNPAIPSLGYLPKGNKFLPS
jgi:hypothetical protein